MNLQLLSKPSKQWTLAVVVGGTALTGIIAFYGISQSNSQSKPTSKPVEVVQTRPKIEEITALGRIEPATEVIKVSVPATLSNDRVAQLLVQRGSSVKAGQAIAIMDSRDRLQNALLEAQAQVKVSQAQLAKVQAGAKSGEIAAQKAEIARLEQELKGEIATRDATISRWQAEVKTANSEYNRYSSLYQNGAISAVEVDRKQLALETTQAQLTEARANQNKSVDTLRQQIKQAKATLDEIAEVRPVDVQAADAEVNKAIAAVKKAEADLAEVYIRAPIAGRILDIKAKPGEVVGEKGIAELGQTSSMEAIAEIYQTDISKVREGQQVTISSESFSPELRGTVRLIGLQVIQQEVTSGEPGENLDRKVIEVRIALDPQDSKRVANLTNLQVQVAIQPNNNINQ
ncbi:ABC transporter permease [Nostoc sp. KVJ20]|uniref:ABC exporter membrane fusion protein n=1 Tax=Nostoc sp. KVJ20 TaxID=457944 RepID=UPI00083E37CF|nr:ABC exporter membrane fusion protein [Nostoc sp. KVJ20]ODG98889.1 ABC transporter permease [Nostoc sp. KVJ20]